MSNINFYKGKRVLITGHTGFKGSWMCKTLLNEGAIVAGYSLEAPTSPNLYGLLKLDEDVNSTIGDIRDFGALKKCFNDFCPEIVIHLAAQPIVRDSYKNPRYTYETNIMGTVNILECIRQSNCVKSFLNVTTDKVYLNNEWVWGYRETDPLDGFDPYSNSKSCSDLVTHSYKKSFFTDKKIAISTARAGNVIGGGDYARDRIIPDCVRAMEKGIEIIVRNPYSTRPYQHVLEPIMAYLMICESQYKNYELADWYNVGPDDCDCVKTGDLVNMFCSSWGNGATWKNITEQNAPHEANYLKLDCSKIKTAIGWKPRWHINEAVEKTVEWSKAWLNNEDISSVMDKQIKDYISE